MILAANNQVFEDGSTYCETLKALAHTMVAMKYNLENAEFDEDCYDFIFPCLPYSDIPYFFS